MKPTKGETEARSSRVQGRLSPHRTLHIGVQGEQLQQGLQERRDAQAWRAEGVALSLQPACTLHTASTDLGPPQATEEPQSQEHCSPACPALGDLGLAHHLHGSPGAHTGRWRRPGSSSPQELNSREDSAGSAPIPALRVGAAHLPPSPGGRSWPQGSQVSRLGAPFAGRSQSAGLEARRGGGEAGRARSLPGRRRGVNSCPVFQAVGCCPGQGADPDPATSPGARGPAAARDARTRPQEKKKRRTLSGRLGRDSGRSSGRPRPEPHEVAVP